MTLAQLAILAATHIGPAQAPVEEQEGTVMDLMAFSQTRFGN